jgi:hypothetical protein
MKIENSKGRETSWNSDNKRYFYAHLHDFGLLLEICMKTCISLKATFVGQALKRKSKERCVLALSYLVLVHFEFSYDLNGHLAGSPL